MTDQPEKGAAEEAPKPDPEWEAIAQLPAMYVDTWYLTTWRGHMRIALGEQFADLQNQYRLALVLELNDAESLARGILRGIERRRKKDAESDEKGSS